MKKNKKLIVFIAFLVITVLMITGCSKVQKPDDTNNIDISEDNIEKKGDEIPSRTDLNEEQNDDSDSNSEIPKEAFFGKVKRIIGNEVEIEIGLVPDQTWDEEIDPEEKKTGVPGVMVKERENPPGMEDIVAPNPPEYGGSIFGENGEINLTYTGESKTLIIPAGTDIRNALGGKATLDSIKKGSVLIIKQKIIDGKDAGIDKLTILG